MEHESYDDVLHVLGYLRQFAHNYAIRPVPDYMGFLIEVKVLGSRSDMSLLTAIALLYVIITLVRK